MEAYKCQNLDELFNELDTDALRYEIEEMSKTKNSNNLFIRGFNFVSNSLTTLEACYTIQCDEHKRTLVLSAEWNLIENKREPKDLVIEFITDERQYVKLAIDTVNSYAEVAQELERVEEFHVKIGLMKHCGWCVWEDIEDAIENTFGRNLEAIKSFLEGRDDYEKVDMTYDQNWGAW